MIGGRSKIFSICWIHWSNEIWNWKGGEGTKKRILSSNQVLVLCFDDWKRENYFHHHTHTHNERNKNVINYRKDNEQLAFEKQQEIDELKKEADLLGQLEIQNNLKSPFLCEDTTSGMSEDGKRFIFVDFWLIYWFWIIDL